MDINNSEDYKILDKMGVEKALSLFPEQIEECLKQSLSSNILLFEADSVLISGMGGSSNAAKIIQGIFEDEVGIRIEVRSDYGLPAWVNGKTLVVANSYSGNTEETLSAIESAQKAGVKVIGVTTGGKIGEMIKSGNIEGAIVDASLTNPTGFPKTGLGVSLGALMGALIKAKIIDSSESLIKEAVNQLKEVRKVWNVKEYVKWVYGSFPVLFGGKPLVGALNAGRNAMCEISRNYTQFYDFPEVNHVLIEALQTPQAAKSNKYIFFESNFNNLRVIKRFEITKDILNEMGIEHKTYKLTSDSKLGQALELAHFCGWMGFYISILDDVDPGPEPWILKLKSSLAQPLH